MNKRTLSCLIGAALLVVAFTLWVGEPRDEPGAPLAGATRTGSPRHEERLDPLPPSAQRGSGAVVVRLTAPNGVPVEGATIEFAGVDSNELGSATSGPTGEIRLPHGGTYLIRARSSGFAREPQLVALGRGSRVVLTPVGSLEIQVPDVHPGAASMIEVELLPPVRGTGEEALVGRAAIQRVRELARRATEDRASSSWELRYEAREEAAASHFLQAPSAGRLSSFFIDFDRVYPYHTTIDPRSLRRPFVDGRVRFDDLPAGPGYRYVVHAGFTISAHPRNEAPPVLFNADGTISPQEGLLPEGLSGAFAIHATTKVEFSLEASTPGSVSGTLAGFDPARDAANVALRHLEVHEHPIGGLTYASGRIDLEVEPDTNGSFLLEPVRAGTNRIQIRQVMPGRELAYVLREFQLAPGEHRDLGVLEPTGASIVCTVRFVTESGEERSANELFANSESIGVAIQEIEPAEPGLADYINVPLGEAFTLSGLTPGRYRLKAFVGRKTVERLRGPRRYDRGVERILLVDVARDELSRVSFDLALSEPGTTVRVVARAPQGTSWTRHPRVRFLSDDEAPELTLNTRNEAIRSGELALRPGPYRVICNVPGNVNLQCVRDVVIPPGPEFTLELDLDPGVAVVGRLVTEDGSPAAAELLQFAHEMGGETVFWESTNAEGRFEVSGVQPGSTLWVRTLDWNAPEPIRVPAQAGRVTVGDVVKY